VGSTGINACGDYESSIYRAMIGEAGNLCFEVVKLHI